MNRTSLLALVLVAFLPACGARSSGLDEKANGASANDAHAGAGNIDDADPSADDGLTSDSNGGPGSDPVVNTGMPPTGNGSSPPSVTGTVTAQVPVPSVTATATAIPSPTVTAPTDMSFAPIDVGEGCPGGGEYPYLDNTDAGFDGVVGFASFGDGATSLCLLQEPGRICAYGTAVSSQGQDNDYQNWGAGFSIMLSPSASQERNLASLNVVSVQLALTNVTGRLVRLLATQPNDPALPADANYADNAFVFGGSSPRNLDSDRGVTIVTVELPVFRLPSWTLLVDESGSSASGQALDPTQVSALQVMVVNNPPDLTEDYSFCVEDLSWLNAKGEQVVLPDAPALEVDAGAAPEVEPEIITLPQEHDAGPSPMLDAGAPAVSDAG